MISVYFWCYTDDVLSGNSAQKQLHTRHQLQKKIHERQEISRQKRRMEEERSHLAGQDSASLVTGRQQNSLSLVSSIRNPSSGTAVRVHASKATGEADRNLPKPILPKMLLPKLPTTVPMSRSILSIDLDHHRAVHPTDPQFILVPQNISHIQHCTPGSVVLISNTPAASTAPPSEVKVSLQSIGLAPLAAATPQPECQNPSQNACDLKVPKISVVSVESLAVSECSYSSLGSKIPMTSCSTDFVKNSTHTLSSSTVSSENPNSRTKSEGLQMAVVVSQGTSVMSPPVGLCPVIIAPQDQVSRPLSLGSTSLKELISQDPVLLSPKNRTLLSVSDRCFEFMSSEGSSSATDSIISLGSSDVSDVQSTIGTAKISVHCNLAPCQGSKVRGRTVSSRAAPRTVSSILDEQRCHSSSGASRALYNDSRNVSQILKELREKHSADELSSVEKTFVGSVLLSELQSDRASSCVNSSLLNLGSQSIQVLKLLHKTNYQSAVKTLLDVQPRMTMQSKRFQPVGLPFQPKQPTATQKTNLQSPSKILVAGQNSSGILSPGTAFQNIVSAEMPMSPLLLQSTASGNCTVELFKALSEDRKVLRNSSSALKCTADRKKEKHSEKPFPFLPSSLGFTSTLGTPQKAEKNCLDRNSCTNLQKLLLKPVQTTLQLVRMPSDVSPCQTTFSKLAQKTVGADSSSSSALSWSCPTASTACSSSFGQNSLKRSATALPCIGTKRIMMDNEQPGVVLVRSLSFDEGNDDVKEDATELTEADMQMGRLHSPGDLQDMLYKDTSLQHYTLQQLSNLQQMKAHNQKESQLRTDPLTDFGSRPASAFGSSKTTILRLSSTEVGQPSRPNTVAAVWDDQNIETEILRPFVESSHGPKTESCGSESSTPMSIQSPRSNMSCGSLYLDQSNMFMPLHMTDSLPTVSAIRPLPKHGQWQAAADMYVTGCGKLESLKRVVANFTTTASSGFTPYPGLDLPRVGISVRHEEFASMHSAKKQRQQSSISRQRHHSAHEAQDSCIKTSKTSSDQLMPQLVSSTGDLSMLLPKLYSIEPSAFSMVSSSCSNILPGIDGSRIDMKEFETADEVNRIISSASQDSLGGNPSLQPTTSNRSQSEPANCLQAGYPLDPYDDFPSIFSSDGDLIADSSAADIENASSRVSDINWGSTSDGKNAPQHPDKLLWRGLTRGDHLISGIMVQPSLSFPDTDLGTTEFVPYENAAIISASFVGTDCSPPESQDPSPEYEGEMPLFDKPVKGLDGFPPGGAHSTVLDTPNSLVGIFNSICSDESDGQNQSSNCGVDFWAPYF